MGSRRLGFQVAIAAACLGGPGIAAAEVHELRVGTSIDPIIGGQVTEPGEFDGVVAIQAGNGLCTGTVVAPRLVLTAAHCLDHLSSDADVVVHYGQEINQMTIQATGWGVHPQFCPDCKEDIYDYGYVEIGADFNVPGGYTLPVVTQEEWDQAMTPGKEVTLVGYGDSSDDGAVQGGIGIKRKGHHDDPQDQPGGARVLRRRQRTGLVQRRLRWPRVRARGLGRAAAGRHHLAGLEPVRQRWLLRRALPRAVLGSAIRPTWTSSASSVPTAIASTPHRPAMTAAAPSRARRASTMRARGWCRSRWCTSWVDGDVVVPPPCARDSSLPEFAPCAAGRC
ncbi:MAG: trypsin-like serine protease [Deltaproteobacteria bacterium]|nr:trypsin-like serine protease [Deltaproteobacteria bacterium]